MSPPGTWTAGDSVSWSATLADYSADDGWSAFWVVKSTDGLGHELGSSGASDVHTVTLSGEETSDWTPGVAEWFLFVRKGKERKTLGKGATRIYPDPQKDYGETFARTMLRLVERALKARAEGDVSERYTIGGVSHDKIPVSELTGMRNYFLAEVSRETSRSRRLATGRKRRGTTRVVFTG